MAGQNKDLARGWFEEVMNTGNVDRIEEFCSRDFVNHEEGPPGAPEGLEGVKFFVKTMHAGFPDLHVDVEDLLEDGDRVVARAKLTGTHSGEFLGVPPSGNRVEIEWIDIVRVEGDKAVEHWGVTDNMGLMQQIGAIPAGAPA